MDTSLAPSERIDPPGPAGVAPEPASRGVIL